MADKPIPAVTTASSQKLIVTSYSTDLSSACLPKAETKKTKGEKKRQSGQSCSESFFYYVKYEAKSSPITKGTLIIPSNGAPRFGTLSKEVDNVLPLNKRADTAASMAKQFKDLTDYIVTLRKPLEEPVATKVDKDKNPKGKIALLGHALLGSTLTNKIINFIILEQTDPKAAREIAVDLMQVNGKRELVLKVLENLKEQAAKSTIPEHQTEKINSLIIEINLVTKVEETLIKETKEMKGDLLSLARSFVATTISGLSPTPGTPPFDFLKSRFDEFAKANPNGVTVVTSGTPPIEKKVDPYQFLFERLSKLKNESTYQGSQSAPGKLLTESLAFLDRAAKDKHIDYITKSPNEAFTTSLKAQISESLLKEITVELNNLSLALSPLVSDWQKWLQEKPDKQTTNRENITKAILDGFTLDDKGEKIKINKDSITKQIVEVLKNIEKKALTPQEKKAVPQLNAFVYLTTLAIGRSLIGAQIKPSIPILKIWSPNKNDFEKISLEKTEIAPLVGTIKSWEMLFGDQLDNIPKPKALAAVPSTDLAPPTVLTPIPPKGPSSQNFNPSSISKFNLIAPWVVDASFCVAGVGLLASGLTAGDRANQGDYGQGDKASIVSGSMFIGACGGGFIGGGLEKLIRNQTGSGNATSIWVAHGVGAVAGSLLGLVSLSRFSAIDPTGGKNNPSNPGMSYGSLRNNLRDFRVVFPVAIGRF